MPTCFLTICTDMFFPAPLTNSATLNHVSALYLTTSFEYVNQLSLAGMQNGNGITTVQYMK